MQHGAGEVEHTADLAALLGGQAFASAAQQNFSGQFGGAELAGAGGVTQIVEQLPQGGQDRVATVAVDQREAG
ncbi:hypothetical protein D3C78_716990 [compost metagenome]